jgi:hypothetical protein
MQASEKPTQERNSGNIDITALADHRRDSASAAIASDVYSCKYQSRHADHPVDVGSEYS